MNTQTTNYWLVAKEGQPRDLVRETGGKATSVLQTLALTKHKRFMPSDYFPMDDRYEYIALTHTQFLALLRQKELHKFNKQVHTAAHGNRHGNDIKRIVVESVEAGRSVAAICEDFGVSRAAVYRWVQGQE